MRSSHVPMWMHIKIMIDFIVGWKLIRGLAILVTVFMTFTLQIAFGQESTPVTVSNRQQANSYTKPITFDVISIKKTKSELTGGSGFTADGFDVRAAMPAFLIVAAYDFKDMSRIRGMASWCVTERYDVQAKVATSDIVEWQKLDASSRRLALQSLLQERFKLRVHRETKQSKIYELVVDKKGPKFREVKPGAASTSASAKEPKRSPLIGQGDTMDFLASELPSLGVSRPVLNKTGLEGRYNFKLKLIPEENAPSLSDSSIRSALKEQLGLDLKSAKGQVETLLVYSIERPSAN